MHWKPFQFDGKTYDLTHLHPCVKSYSQPAKGTNPPRGYRTEVIFSLHCFTRDMDGETPNPDLFYSDNRETRHFDFRRYELSFHLPGVVDGLMTRKCFHTERGNYFTLDVLDEHGTKVEYEVYFTASKSSTAGVINLYIQSAYPRDAAYRQSRPQKNPKPIGFAIILYNTLNKIPIKVPK